jgi:sugar phosphate isomerase/epimerase
LVHIADSNRKYPGAGHIDFKEIIFALLDIGYGGYVSCEILPWPDSDTAASKTYELVCNLLNEYSKK